MADRRLFFWVRLRSNPPSESDFLIDHGLYRELTPEFRFAPLHDSHCLIVVSRKDYCNLWKAIVLRDKEAIEKYCRKMGAGDFFQMFVVVLTFRPLNEYVSFSFS